jgi:acetyl-CoA carboxylase carboxyl transferase subunit beta
MASWFSKIKAPRISGDRAVTSRDVPEGLWTKCHDCGEILLQTDIEKNFNVCPKCDYHFKISGRERIQMIIDDGSFEELNPNIQPLDPLKFKDSKRYPDRVKDSQKHTGESEAFVFGRAKIRECPVSVGSFNFHFMGGSMGSVVGEKITRTFELGIREQLPVIIFSSSGGARMQEGILSLMQMAKSTAALGRLRSEHLPFISILTDPTTGGVAASFATLGDIIIAEPKALIGFAGPRVIEQTIKQKLPEGFQRSEFLLEHGMVDIIVHRRDLRETVGNLLTTLYAKPYEPHPAESMR